MQTNTQVVTDHHKFHTHLPRNGREGIFFFLIISVISVNLIAPVITFSEIGASWATYRSLLPLLPFIWLGCAFSFLMTDKIAGKMAQRLTHKGDSFRATITITVLCNVLLMSILMTVIGTWIGTKQISLSPIVHFFAKWPRNFMISLIVESLVAQPIARYIISRVHFQADKERKTF
ncbi:hypothetical protein ACFO26_10215 [Lactococcus nasutitermitis]|uniref:DUF2798 domain-containing protein n=1 Tax=Lactococcus nasutitermitis TaxID=1652957 RepID=A0ABV9JF30_9LACT|nr:hypothetical protein [Lactococcus nasutitermitis]